MPQPLLDALEGTISVIMESRSEIEEITSALLSPASTSGYVGLRGREAGRGAAAGRSPGPAGGRLGSPYTSDRGTSRTTPTKQGHRTPSKHIRQLASHPSPHASSPSQPLSAASASPSHGPPRGGGRGSYGSGQGSASGRGGFASGSVRRDSGSGGGGSWDDGLGPSASNVSVGAASSVGGSSRVTIGGRSAAGGSTANGYLYQRVAARQAALEEEERRAALVGVPVRFLSAITVHMPCLHERRCGPSVTVRGRMYCDMHVLSQAGSLNRAGGCRGRGNSYAVAHGRCVEL